MKNKLHNGIAVALAWPETKCKQPGAWYDGFMQLLGINKNFYYKVGHAALLLVNKQGGVKYFDFGRYQAPFAHGRVRSAKTDWDLEVKTTANISYSGKSIENLNEILEELQQNKACHGNGTLYAGECPVDYELAIQKAESMQNQGAIKYGPFQIAGSNCSRFVNTAILAGKPDFRFRFNLNFAQPLTPTPMGNVKSLLNITSAISPFTEVKLQEIESETFIIPNDFVRCTRRAM